MNYGFLIRNDRCIGCHACSTACKAENEVPLGVHRTWVKTVEVGAFPDVGRHFQVTRCNHCANPPCVTICPTQAMYRRKDGIVEFDPDRCIGCKACLQACPYDAIHIDPESGTAAKCHFCAHRVELSMEPPCVVVCPEHAIIAGDLDDPDSEITRMLSQYRVTVRKPEQGTRPKLFYVNGEESSLTPTASAPDPAGQAWAETQGSAGGVQGPIRIGRGRMAGDLVRTTWDVEHRVPWHWPVPAYLVTKGVASGIFLLLAGGFLSGLVPFAAPAFLAGGLLVLLFLGATTALLVADLERPERFLKVLTIPHKRSWLVRGAWILIGFSTLTGVWWLLELAGWLGWMPPPDGVRPWLLAAGIPLAGLTAIYTAFLFGQAEGRDLWQSPLLPAHLLVQALIAGGAVLLVLNLPLDLPTPLVELTWWVFAVALAVDLLVLLPGEFGMSHQTEGGREAAHAILRGPWRRHFWGGAVVLGHIVPLALLGAGALLQVAGLGGGTAGGAEMVAGMEAVAPWPAVASGVFSGGLAGLLALVGLYLYEHAYVMAPQNVRNS